MTRPVRSTSSPACRCQYSPSSTTPISSSSTLKAMPNTPPGNLTNSSKPTPGRPETLAMPVAMLVIVPTSRGSSCGVKASRDLAHARERAVEDTLQALRRSAHRARASGLGSQAWSQAWPQPSARRLGLRASPQSWLGFASASACLGTWLALSCSFRSSPTPFSSDPR